MEQKNIHTYGYHISEIKKGTLGESSKILEEVYELIDAEKQEAKIMCIVELADIIGAIDLYIKHKKLGITLDDLRIMSEITKRAFISGHRK